MIEKVKFSDYDNITEVIAEGLTDLRRKKDIVSFLDIFFSEKILKMFYLQ